MIFETERLIIREFTAEDIDSAQRYGGDPENVWFMGWGPNDRAATAEFIERKLADQSETPRREYDMAVCLRDTGEHIGSVGLTLDVARTSGELGWILRKDMWRNGYTTEAARALMRFGFEQLGLHRITARCNAANIASYRVMEKLRMRREAYFRSARYERVGEQKEWTDEYVYAILKSEWIDVKGR